MTAPEYTDLAEMSWMRLCLELLRVLVTQRGAARRLLRLVATGPKLLLLTVAVGLLNLAVLPLLGGEWIGALSRPVLDVAVFVVGPPTITWCMVMLVQVIGVPAMHRRSGDVFAARWLSGFAAFIGGRTCAAAEWRSHLAGESGAGLSKDRQVREAAGFLLAAMRYRLQDLADLLWRPVDAILASRELSNLVVLAAALGVAIVFIRQDGLYGLADNLGSVAVVWGAAYGLIRLGRGWRDVTPHERKPHRQKHR